MGTGASMLWWDEEFCRMLADGGRYVIRYDHRDTGRSVTYEPGRPGYGGDDLVTDAAAILDAYEIPAAHLVGGSAGGALAQVLALGHPKPRPFVGSDQHVVRRPHESSDSPRLLPSSAGLQPPSRWTGRITSR
jgi:pimeloyl-ACP methyl ester carboxylesterase